MLKRVRKDSVLGGVCTGLGKYTQIETSLWRIIFLFLTILGFGTPIILYCIMWLVLPEELT